MAIIFYKTAVVSLLPPEILIDRLKQHFSLEGGREYSGRTDGHSFKMNSAFKGRIVGWNVIKGMIEATDGGSIIRLTMRPHIIVLVFISFFTAMFIYIFLNTVIFFDHSRDVFGYVIPFLLPLIVVLIFLRGFIKEVGISKDFLVKLFREDEYDEDEGIF
jgi:hypothetical protein